MKKEKITLIFGIIGIIISIIIPIMFEHPTGTIGAIELVLIIISETLIALSIVKPWEYKSNSIYNTSLNMPQYCGNCGNKLNNNSKFCGNCGNEINIIGLAYMPNV